MTRAALVIAVLATLAGDALAGLEEQALVAVREAARGDDLQATLLVGPHHHRPAVALHQPARAVQDRAAELLARDRAGMGDPVFLEVEDDGEQLVELLPAFREFQ